MQVQRIGIQTAIQDVAVAMPLPLRTRSTLVGSTPNVFKSVGRNDMPTVYIPHTLRQSSRASFLPQVPYSLMWSSHPSLYCCNHTVLCWHLSCYRALVTAMVGDMPRRVSSESQTQQLLLRARPLATPQPQCPWLLAGSTFLKAPQPLEHQLAGIVVQLHI